MQVNNSTLFKEGSWDCVCQSGFVENNGTCHDIDECRNKTHNCTENERCLNIGKLFEFSLSRNNNF